MKRPPVIGVTGPIASGKTTVARAIAGRRGALVDCDSLAHRALEDPLVKWRVVAAFGEGILGPSGRVSRRRLRGVVFGNERSLRRFNRIVRARVRAIIEAEVKREKGRAEYIVLDAVLLFQYKFKFEIDFAVATRAPAAARLARIIKRDGVTRAEAKRVMERQKGLERGWAKADAAIDTGAALAEVRREARRLRDEFFARPPGARSGSWRTSSRAAK